MTVSWELEKLCSMLGGAVKGLESQLYFEAIRDALQASK